MRPYPAAPVLLSLPWLVAASLAAGCASTGTETAGGEAPVTAEAATPAAPAEPAEPAEQPEAATGEPGSSCETAIVIDADTTREGIDAEYRWLAEHFPGYRTEEQSLIRCGDAKMADLIEIRTADGRSVGIFFDITSFFGKR